MDIKSRKINLSPFKKMIMFLIVITCFSISSTMFVSLMKNTNGIGQMLEPSFVKSSELFHYQQNFYIGLNNLLRLRSEDYILQGNTINKEEFENRKKQLFYQWYGEINSYINQYSDGYVEEKIDLYKLLKERFEEENAEKINEIYYNMISEQLRGYYSLLERVNNKEGLYYYATNGENVYTNTDQTDKEFYTSFKAYYISDKDSIKATPMLENNMNLSYMMDYTDASTVNKIYIAASDEYIAKRQAEWEFQSLYLKNGITIILSSIALLLIALIYLVWRAGRREDDKIHLITIDRLYSDVSAAIVFGIIITWFAIHIEIIRDKFLNYVIIDSSSIKPDFWIVILLNLVFSSIVLMLSLSLIRHIKNKTLFSNSLIYIILKKLIRMISSISIKAKNMIKIMYNSGPLSLRIVALIIVSEFLLFILIVLMISTNPVLGFLCFLILCGISLAGIYYVLIKIKSFNEIAVGVQQIKNGMLDYNINLNGDDDLSKLAADINDIADGLKNAVEKEIRAEKLKTDLITNVSHDLKTPLTSIINYVDLLSNENLVPNSANEYVSILKQKSEKLKLLTQDLFEISKVQSGNVSVEFEKIDIGVLLKQCLAEFDEHISSSGLDFKVNIHNADTYVLSDGKLLSRVFENLISNILKYSLANTRVYVDIFTDNSNVVIELKNIANYEMNFKEEDIVERFVRGDISRTTDGNGLGLAIAKNYVGACGGSFKISVDGDLFKASIKFSKA